MILRRWWLAIALLAIAEVRPAAAPGPPRAQPMVVARTRAVAPLPVAVASSESPPPPSPASLAGTDVDGALRVDASGDLVLDADLRRFFDYHLTATGEEPDAAIRARLEAAIDARLPPAAARQATALLARYLGCRDGARTLPEGGDLAARIASVRALRRDCLGPDAATKMYAAEDAQDDVALARRQVIADTAPGSPERAAGLAEAVAAQPPAARATEAAVTAPIVTLERERELRAGGGSPEEIRAVREAAFGPDGADRLEALDRTRAAWQSRLDSFRAARAALGDDDDAAAQLLARDFTEAEQLRVEALERLAGHPIRR